MALSNYVQMRDGMSNVLSRIASNLSAVNNRFERLQGLAEQAVPTDIYSQRNSELVGIREEFARTVSAVYRSSVFDTKPICDFCG